MDDVMRSYREADLAFLEAANTIAFSMDTSDMDLFMESSDNKDKSGFVDTIVDKVRTLVEKIKKFFEDLFSSAKIKSLKDRASSAFKNDKALEAKKVEVLDTGKIMGFSKKYKEKIKNAKSEEEIDQIVAEYNKKKKVGFVAGAATTIGLGVLAKKVLVPGYKNANDKYMDALQKESEEAGKVYRDAVDKFLNEPHGDNNNNDILNAAKAKRNQAKSKANPGFLKKQVSVLNLMITDQVNALKTAMSSKIKAISDAIHHKNSEQELLGITDKTKVAGEKLGSFVKNGNQILNNDGSLNVKATQEMYSESVEGSLFAFEEGYQEFDDSAVEGAGKIAKAIGEFIDKLIQKLREFVQNVKDKAEVAKTKTILNSNLAKSKIMIKFAFHDKDIVKAVDGYYKLLNQSIIAMEKLTQKIKAGKINMDEFYAAGDKIDAEFEKQLVLLKKTYYSQKADARIESNVYEAMKIRDYLIKLESYQTKKITEMHETANKALNKIREDARKVAEAEAAAAAEKAQAAKAASRTKKVIAAVVSTIGLTAAVGIFATRLKSKSSSSSDFKGFSESVDELTESMTLEEFTEAAMI